MSFGERLQAQVERTDSLICIGLDPDLTRFPQLIRNDDRTKAIVDFNRAIVEATLDITCAYKPNLGFYVAQGVAGVRALVETRNLIPRDVPVILDCKVGDMGSTAAAYASGYFGEWDFDAITANPYQGEDSLAPFLSHPDKGVFILCRTSNPSSGDLQDLDLASTGAPVYKRIAERSITWARDYPATVGLVVGATYPERVAEVRATAPELPILLPGVGAQAGDVEGSAEAGVRADGTGLLVAPSRSVIYAGSGPDFADRARDAALELRSVVNAARQRRTEATAQA
jgi:orotidine-5'-phosphate decarboxylase